MEGVVPSNWVSEKYVFWPPVQNATKYVDKRSEPDKAKWNKFRLVKVKFSSGKQVDHVSRLIFDRHRQTASTEDWLLCFCNLQDK